MNKVEFQRVRVLLVPIESCNIRYAFCIHATQTPRRIVRGFNCLIALAWRRCLCAHAPCSHNCAAKPQNTAHSLVSVSSAIHMWFDCILHMCRRATLHRACSECARNCRCPLLVLVLLCCRLKRGRARWARFNDFNDSNAHACARKRSCNAAICRHHGARCTCAK